MSLVLVVFLARLRDILRIDAIFLCSSAFITRLALFHFAMCESVFYFVCSFSLISSLLFFHCATYFCITHLQVSSHHFIHMFPRYFSFDIVAAAADDVFCHHDCVFPFIAAIANKLKTPKMGVKLSA